MASQDHLPELERLILATVGQDRDTVDRIAGQLGRPPEVVGAAVSRLVQACLVHTAGDTIRLTQQGWLIVHGTTSPAAVNTGQAGVPAVGNVAGSVESVWSAYVEQRAAARARARAGLLASDKDRDAASQLLADAFAQGRLSSTDFEARTERALAAATHGDLDDVLQGLGGLQRPAGNHPVRKGIFGVVAFVSSPFLLFGLGLLLSGSDADDRVAGIVFIVLFLPGLIALWRWAWPRR